MAEASVLREVSMGKIVFIDESGNEGMQTTKRDVSSHYVVGALVVEEADLPTVMAGFEAVRRAHHPQGEMKSQHLKNDERRLKILEGLAAQSFGLHLLVVDKNRLTSPGYGYPKSFIKNLQGRLYDGLARDYPRVRIRADRIKGASFMQEFQAYLQRKAQGELFSPWNFEFVDSKAEICVQALDVIAGTIARRYEGACWAPDLDEFMQVLRKRVLRFDFFPPIRRMYLLHGEGEREGAHDATIESRAYDEAWTYVQRLSDSDEEEDRLHVELLNALLGNGLVDRYEEWVPTGLIRRRLSKLIGEDIGEHRVRTLVGQLRDRGVLIASRRAGGYKLPTSVGDLNDFVDTQNAQLTPMLRRMAKARETVRRATDGTLDILAAEAYAGLRHVVDALGPWPDGAPEVDSDNED